MIKIINLTPHTVNIVRDGKIFASYPSEGVARVATENKIVAEIDETPVYKTAYGETLNLPSIAPGKIYIVSMVVAMANKGRPDLISPNTAPDSAVRDETGNIIGVKSFSIY